MRSEPTAGRLDEKMDLSKEPVPTVNGTLAEIGEVSTNRPEALAVASPTISAETAVDAVRPVMPRLKDIADPEHVVSELQVTVPDTIASVPLKLWVKPLTVKGVDGAAAAVNEEIVPAEALMVPIKCTPKLLLLWHTCRKCFLLSFFSDFEFRTAKMTLGRY